MPKKIKKEDIHRVVEKIVNEFDPEKVILFGSYAWGKPTENSDFDLFVVKDTPERRLDRVRAVHKIIWGSGLPIDLLVYTPAELKKRLDIEDFFFEDIISKGEVLYDKG